MIRGAATTTGNVHDAAEPDAFPREAPGATYGDSAYAGARLAKANLQVRLAAMSYNLRRIWRLPGPGPA